MLVNSFWTALFIAFDLFHWALYSSFVKIRFVSAFKYSIYSFGNNYLLIYFSVPLTFLIINSIALFKRIISLFISCFCPQYRQASSSILIFLFSSLSFIISSFFALLRIYFQYISFILLGFVFKYLFLKSFFHFGSLFFLNSLFMFPYFWYSSEIT